jgi:hypothetical protein
MQIAKSCQSIKPIPEKSIIAPAKQKIPLHMGIFFVSRQGFEP